MSEIITELEDRTCRTGSDEEVMHRASVIIRELDLKLAARECDLLDADNLAKVIDQEIKAHRIDARSPIADARLDYERLPPNHQRSE